MTVGQPALLAFNRGILSPLGLARTDLKRYAMSAEIQNNWMPRLVGSMMLRPGLGYLGQVAAGNGQAKFLPHIFATDDTSLLEFTNLQMRVWINDQVLIRPSVGTTVANGTFTTDLSSWTSADESGATSAWVTGSFMSLTGNGTNSAKRYQTLTVAAGDKNVEHGIRIVVSQYQVTVLIGTTAGDGSYMTATLGTGTHSLSIVPTGNFTIEFSNGATTPALVKSVAIEATGAVVLPAPYTTSDLPLLRYDQSGDIVYIACDGHQQQKIERRGARPAARSWSVTTYQPMDGPFGLENITPITLTPSALTGSITLTASETLFQSGHVGALFRLASVGQTGTVAAAGTNQWSPAIKITGIGNARNFAIIITGTFNATVVLQQSVGAIGAWTDVPGKTWTAAITTNYLDGLDNQTIFYRIGIEGTYTSGTATSTVQITSGSIEGVCRITAVNSNTSANAIVLTQPGNTGVLQGLGSTTATQNWFEGQWSTKNGWPTSVALYEGRMWWAGRDSIGGSVSDAYESYDDTQIGDSGPIIRTIGSGPVDVVNWLLPLQRLVLGAQGAEKSCRSSSFDSPLTPADFLMKDAATQGSAAINAVKIDFNGLFVQKSGRRIFELNYSPNFFMMDYSATDITKFVPDIAIAPGGFVTLALQRMPDTRIHAVMANGTVAVLVYDPTEDERAWVTVSTPGASGFVEDAVVLPGAIEDQVYYVVRRTVNGTTVRYLEKWAREDQCQGGAQNLCADAYVTGSNSPASATISGLTHLVGQTVIVWADGINQGTAVVQSNGTATLSAKVSSWVAGLGYTAQFKSTKLAYAAQLGTALNQRKHIARLGLILANAHYQGIQYGQDFTTLRDLPTIVDGVIQPANTIYTSFDQPTFDFPGTWSTDSRLCLQAKAPLPVTVLAAVIDMETRESA